MIERLFCVSFLFWGGEMLKTQDLYKIKPHREPLIDRAVRTFRSDFNLINPIVDCVEIAKYINRNPDRFNIRIQSSSELSSNHLANTIYIQEFDLYYVIVNRSQLFDESGRARYHFEKSSDRVLNFTLAHEFGHIYLEHAYIPNSDKSLIVNQEEDLEADEFAGRLLMPERSLKSANFSDLDLVARTFNVSLSALDVRLTHLNVLELKESGKFPTCEKCGNTTLMPTDNYCSICASALSSTKGVLTMNYDDGIILDENGQLTICPRCSNSHFEAGDAYCSICGMPLKNRCTSDNCSVSVIHNSSARQCSSCGSPTTILISGMIEPWEQARNAQFSLISVEDETLGPREIKYISSDDWIDFVTIMILSQKKALAMILLHATARYSDGKLLIIFRKSEDKFRFLARKSHMNIVIEAFSEFFDLPLSKINSASYEEFQPTLFFE